MPLPMRTRPARCWIWYRMPWIRPCLLYTSVQIDEGVVIAPGATILAGTILRGKTVLGAGCVIGPNTLIEDSTVAVSYTHLDVYKRQILMLLGFS